MGDVIDEEGKGRLLRGDRSAPESAYDQNDAENAGRAVAPTGAMTPGRNRANQEQDQYDDENSTEHSCAP